MNSTNKSYDPDPSILGDNYTIGKFNFRAATVLALPKEGQLPAKMETNKKKISLCATDGAFHYIISLQVSRRVCACVYHATVSPVQRFHLAKRKYFLRSKVNS